MCNVVHRETVEMRRREDGQQRRLDGILVVVVLVLVILFVVVAFVWVLLFLVIIIIPVAHIVEI